MTQLIPTNILRASGYIDKNISEQDIETSLLIAQETMLQPVIGTVLYEKLIELTDINDASSVFVFPDEYYELTINKIHKLITFYTVYQLINTKIYRITGSGVVKDDDSVTLDDLRDLRSNIRGIYLGYEKMTLDYLKAHTATFPEFESTIEGGDNANTSEDTTNCIDMTTLFNED